MQKTEELDLRDPRTLFKLWFELTGEDLLNTQSKKHKKGVKNEH